MIENKMKDYKLSATLNQKINKKWDKDDKYSKYEKTNIPAREEQAGLIITRWAKDILNKEKNKRKTKKYPKNKDRALNKRGREE